jgi:predicted amidohydrolase YtcJ
VAAEVHAIGDEAAEAVLEAFEKAGVRPEDRPILTHCQILGPDLLDTMARLGVIANVQPQVLHYTTRTRTRTRHTRHDTTRTRHDTHTTRTWCLS